jgi:DNA-binding GntR family transcriptional regulator
MTQSAKREPVRPAVSPRAAVIDEPREEAPERARADAREDDRADARANSRADVSADVSAVERTIGALRQGIESGIYVPGQRLVEPDLTAALGVSRSSLREAFRRLSAEGIVDIVPNRGAAVRRFSVDDVRNIQQLRGVLEPLAASLAADGIDAAGRRASFDAVAAVWLDAPPVHDIDQFTDENRRFHRVIAEISGNEQLATIMERLNMRLFAAHFRQRITLAMRAGAAAEHREIALAIGAGDGQRARKAMELHVRRATRSVSMDVSRRQLCAAREGGNAGRPAGRCAERRPMTGSRRHNPGERQWLRRKPISKKSGPITRSRRSRMAVR